MKISRAGSVLIVAVAGCGIAYGAETVTYTYDALGRLVLANYSGVLINNTSSDVLVNYQYDKADNRKQVTVTGAP